ncbi:MAG: hypothetical protein JST80_00170 [Bdellovibrionales bacterium]|nr:hypothetical protein [Bdellovibrionales bacterium]
MGSWAFKFFIFLVFSSCNAFATVGTLVDYKSIDSRSIGSIGLDTSSFMYKAKGRDTSATTFEASLGGQFDTAILHGVGSAQFFTFVNNSPQLGFEAPELYLSTQKNLLDAHTITVGRRKFEWSKVDKEWNMMSLWSPRFTWDQIYPETIGMTGLFYTYETPRFKFMAFGSPIAIPERGTPISEENGNIVSPNPFWNPLPSQLSVQGAPTQINYTLLMPALQDILLRPNFAVRGYYDLGEGFWLSANAGVLPVNMTQLAAEPYYYHGNINVNIRPQFPMRNLYTAEFGYNDSSKLWNAWMSVSYEKPFNFENNRNWLNPVITPTSVVSLGTDFQVTNNFRFDGAILFVREQEFVRDSSLPNINVDLPTRYPLKQGIKAAGTWSFSDTNEATVAWIQDLVQSSNFVSFDLQHKIFSANMSIGGGADLMLANTNKGWVGQYYGDDRLRGWLKYAF